MKVKATKAGYCGGYRMAGDVFEAEDGLTASWCVPLEQPEAEAEQPEAGRRKK